MRHQTHAIILLVEKGKREKGEIPWEPVEQEVLAASEILYMAIAKPLDYDCL